MNVSHAAVEDGIDTALDFDDDKSSSLSEPDDDDDEDQEDEHSIGRLGGPVIAQRGVDIDSEAETERLEQTPQKLRKQLDRNQVRTPSKLAAVEPGDAELSEPPSPMPGDPGAASSTSTMAAGGKKRKRSDMMESPLTSEDSDDGELPRKRNHGTEEETPATGYDQDTTETVEDTTAPVSAKGPKGRRGKQKRGGRKAEEASETPIAAETVELEDLLPDHDGDETAAIKVEEDPVRKSEAADMFTTLTKQFTAFRDALFNERLASVDAELALLEHPQCPHPEYTRMVACVEQRRSKQEREARALYHYQQGSIRQRTLAERAQLHSQYFQTVRELREDALEKLGEDWYAIQRERRQGGALRQEEDSRYTYKYVDKRGDLLRQQAKYNREVSVLSGMAKWVGFPAAPEIEGVEGDHLEGDLRAMKLARRIPQHTPQTHNSTTTHQHPHQHQHSHAHVPYAPRPNIPTIAPTDRLAHDQYIEQHAWARAPQSISAINHTAAIGTPNISHTPDWAEGFRKSGSTTVRHSNALSPGGRASPLVTPIDNRQRKDMRDGGIDGQDVPDSGDHAGKRGGAPGGSSPLQVPKHRHTNGTEREGWRNISGTSTIDAPLADTNHDEHQDSELVTSARLDLVREDTNHSRVGLPALSTELGAHGQASFDTSSLHRHPASTPLSAADKVDVYRTAGFRPLDGAFGTPTPGSAAIGNGRTG